ncbi:NUDIX hydrolase [Pseudorhodoferax sp.]|uniref:NUDIX hydrolase n=1 Tax=Pseudorhodoferax sp. TaxID=1993553 RepID=UPI002DD6A1D2|nr:NUDIX domain-containing protein [Pseudorhodoferax sp.]
MSGLALDPAWRAALLARAEQPPLAPRVPLMWQEREIGSIEPALPLALGCLAAADGTALLCREGVAYCVRGALGDSLARLAQALRAAGLAHAWRDEQLAVCDVHGVPLASVERAVVRVLGIATRAVHLVGFDARGHVWLQQRAFDKPNDPGLWDTLMGGMVAAGDTLDTALERETWEESGLRLDALEDLYQAGWVHQRRPAADGTRHGYLVEDIAWSRCVLPAGLAPSNQDGEVERFECVPPAQVLERLQQGLFTDEAALILVEALGV